MVIVFCKKKHSFFINLFISKKKEEFIKEAQKEEEKNRKERMFKVFIYLFKKYILYILYIKAIVPPPIHFQRLKFHQN